MMHYIAGVERDVSMSKLSTENKQDIIDSMAEKMMLNFRISPAKAYEVVESILHPLKLLPSPYQPESEG